MSVPEKSDGIGISVERTRQNETAQDEESDDGSRAICAGYDEVMDDHVEPAVLGARRQLIADVIADHRQSGDATQGFEAREKIRFFHCTVDPLPRAVSTIANRASSAGPRRQSARTNGQWP